MIKAATVEDAAYRAMVVGASRGIGLGLVRVLLTHGWQVTATVRDTARTPPALSDLQKQHDVALEIIELDLGQSSRPAELAQSLGPQALNLLVISAGIMGPDHQRAEQASREETGELFDLNAMAPLRLARALLPAMTPQGVIGFLSSRMGSVSLNDSGDRELYRASKAALNSLTRGFAVNEAIPAGVGVLNLHPGWVQTDMGGDDAPVTVEQSVTGLVKVLEGALGRSEQRFVDFEDQTLTW
ncbi:SDR family oxidoreductase [Kushneria indalinina]|uniref:Short-subunit dehydrogenase n=1 Tax=Kushneria indalinina DSM 14324 TaxID=1122140 RepID=A0A3D9DXT7_9GAMM|nr:SDR family oxidoreductase [Kushneria indalinina]REC95588.1 short-subunit dehydrogenase [Kushneria indalinina DSM 14324]